MESTTFVILDYSVDYTLLDTHGYTFKTLEMYCVVQELQELKPL